MAVKPGIITNPILPGFNPDPSICRVNDDYYIATSTFEWYPGVQIHHSKDLINWRLACRPLNRASQLDMRGNPDSCGIWAPCLSFADGRFWLVYTDVKRFDGNFKDAHNYIVTAPSIEGPWSDPVHVNSSGFDPTLFHDDDGRKYFANMVWNHRASGVKGGPRETFFGGILLQEWDAKAGRLTGPVTNIYQGTKRGLVEGPHLFKRNGWYYLTTAEGGTGYDHAVTLARSKDLLGPYETHPDLHVISSADDPDARLPRAGHGQMVETPDGEVYHTHLCSRPLPGIRKSPLGRETAIQKCVWRDGWLYLEHGGMVPQVEVPAPKSARKVKHLARKLAVVNFDENTLPDEFQWLRTPSPERLFSLDARPGRLRLFGRESVGSWFEQALVARRQEHHAFRVETRVEFEPETFQQAAGLTYYYNRFKFHALMITHDEDVGGRVLSIMSSMGHPDGTLTYPPLQPVMLPATGPIDLAAEVDGAVLRFFVKFKGKWTPLAGALDASLVSDEGGVRGEHGSFTGAFVGMLAFDITGQGKYADFDGFSYKPL
jgi:xylan 1,4-beta-xylosidase